MRENKNLEYKENTTSNTFLKTISAYANYGNGKIIFVFYYIVTVFVIYDPVYHSLIL